MSWRGRDSQNRLHREEYRAVLVFFLSKLVALEHASQKGLLTDLLSSLMALLAQEKTDYEEFCRSEESKERVKRVDQVLVVFKELASRVTKKADTSFKESQAEHAAMVEKQFLRFEGSKENRVLFRQNSERSGVLDVRQRLQRERESRQNLSILFDVIAQLRSTETSLWYRESACLAKP